MDKNLILDLIKVTEKAAIASALLKGNGDNKACDKAAVVAMRQAFENVYIQGKIVIGEGERDKAPMLFIGEEVGCGDTSSPKIDIAVDPLEGTSLCAYNKANSLSVIAAGLHGDLLHAPDVYMEKIAVAPYAKGLIDLDFSVEKNLRIVAKAKGVSISELMVVILDRPRHKKLIEEVRQTNARIKLIEDGDVAAAIATCIPKSGIDVLLGSGGAPEGVLAAAALRCLGGDMQARLIFSCDEEKERSKNMGITDVNKKWLLEELVKGDVLFVATGVTDGDFLKGVSFEKNIFKTYSLAMCSSSKTMRTIKTIHLKNLG